MAYGSIATTPEAELLVVQQAARLITKSTDPEPSIQGILRLLSELLGLNRGRVLLPDADTGALEIRYAYGLTREERARGRYMIGEGITGRVYQTGQLALIQNIDEEPTYLARAVDRTTLPDEAVAFIAVPIVIEEYPAGVLGVHRLRQRERPFQRDVALLQVLATFIGQVLRVNELIAERTAHLISENRLLKNKLESKGARYGIMGQSPALQQAIQQALNALRQELARQQQQALGDLGREHVRGLRRHGQRDLGVLGRPGGLGATRCRARRQWHPYRRGGHPCLARA